MTHPVSDYDLHSHSTRSDGVLLPAQVVERAAQRGVKALALTDHDDLSGLAEARTAADGAGIRLIDGVEISVSWQGHALHIVGLAINPQNAILVEGLRNNRGGRNGRAERIAAGLAGIGIDGALEGAKAYVTNPDLVSRAHFARFLVESGRVRNTQAAFDRYLGEGKPGHVPHLWASLGEALDWIAAAGGVAVIAHPGRYRLDETQRAALLTEFRDLGGVAIEVVTGSHSPEEYGYWAKCAAAHRLLASAGSDFHGPRAGYKDLGDLPPLPPGCAPVWERF
jgi:predicted metal-dependent phosphoesterase TrpH